MGWGWGCSPSWGGGGEHGERGMTAVFSLVSSFYSFQDPGPWVLPPVRIHVSTSANLLCKTPPGHAHTLFSWVIPGCAKSAINANHSRIIYFFVDMLILEVTSKHIRISSLSMSWLPSLWYQTPTYPCLGPPALSGEQSGPSFTWPADERCWESFSSSSLRCSCLFTSFPQHLC